MVANELDVDFAGFTVPLCHGDKWLVNKSPFIYGKHKIEYESRTYKKVVHLQYLTESTREILLYYIESQVPPGVAIEVRSYKLVEMPSKMKEAIKNESLVDSDLTENERLMKLDDMESRRARKEQFEIYRKPWNPSEYDWRRTEISQRKRRLRTPNTKGNL
ncbi:Oidioi.mRNA.OKI2018_I69.XSR.g13588.t1.cds [Oikopleura dioica]|uniref:Small ribosomal subunit protein uS10m n=1 Tax=Oikopleura dioica TaxID=34765 RepID=A0ABN7S909_OIKDI|nr:Oidioi.mRNA.OKI2018_I69.XSR.g13588.t1.cds [Oikopleura dioica]